MLKKREKAIASGKMPTFAPPTRLGENKSVKFYGLTNRRATGHELSTGLMGDATHY